MFLILLFNFYISVQALDSPKNYLKGKFYSSIKNNFLVATDKMRDPRFKNTVVVMLDNDESGAFGLVINKPLGSIPLGSLINKLESKNSKIISRNENPEVFVLKFVNYNIVFLL